jgi:predicted RNA binding protein YcfA (HicA-like mRNA interferase family)
MSWFPVDPPIRDVIRASEQLGFRLVREGPHISMVRKNKGGTKTPSHHAQLRTLKSSTPGTILSQCEISREEFLKVYKA